MQPLPFLRRAAAPAPFVGALAAAAWLAGIAPGARWSEALALLALTAVLAAGHERRWRDMMLAAGLAAGLAPAGLLLAPLCLGLAIRHGTTRHLPGAVAAALLANLVFPWDTTGSMLPNLATLARLVPAIATPVAAIGAGSAAWLAARATLPRAGVLLAEARLGGIVLATILPLPLASLGFVMVLAAWPLPVRSGLHAANDNMAVHRRIARLAA